MILSSFSENQRDFKSFKLQPCILLQPQPATNFYQGKMNFLTLISLILIHKYMAMKIDLGDTELQNNILKFGYSINYKYMGTISHSFDRFYVATKFELPKVEDLQFTTIPYDKNCEHLEDAKRKGGLTLICVEFSFH